MKYLRTWLDRVWFYFWPPTPPELPITTQEPAPLPVATLPPDPLPETTLDYAPERTTTRKTRSSVLEFKKDILDQLPRYRKYLVRMKAVDRQSYDLFCKIGMQMSPEYQLSDEKNLDPWFLQTLPSFGAITWGVGREQEAREKASDTTNNPTIAPRFIYFRKYKIAPKGCQLTNEGAIYVMTAYFDDLKGRYKTGVPCECPIVVRPDGSVKILLMLMSFPQVIQHKKGGVTALHHQRWGILPIVKEWAGENKVSPAEMVSRLFIATANTFQQSHAEMIRITAAKDGIVGSFSIPVTDTPSFFKDRELVLNNKGSKARIFHVRRAHVRSANGKTMGVKMSFVGLRDFKWNGHHVTITVPGRDAVALAEIRTGAHDEDRMVEMGQSMDGMAPIEDVIAGMSAADRRRFTGSSVA